MTANVDKLRDFSSQLTLQKQREHKGSNIFFKWQAVSNAMFLPTQQTSANTQTVCVYSLLHSVWLAKRPAAVLYRQKKEREVTLLRDEKR